MADRFASYPDTLISQARRHSIIVPSDTEDLIDAPKALYANTEGYAAIRDELGQDVVYYVLQGLILPLRPKRVLATGTTAQLIAWA